MTKDINFSAKRNEYSGKVEVVVEFQDKDVLVGDAVRSVINGLESQDTKKPTLKIGKNKSKQVKQLQDFLNDKGFSIEKDNEIPRKVYLDNSKQPVRTVEEATEELHQLSSLLRDKLNRLKKNSRALTYENAIEEVRKEFHALSGILQDIKKVVEECRTSQSFPKWSSSPLILVDYLSTVHYHISDHINTGKPFDFMTHDIEKAVHVMIELEKALK